jgi:putative peptidoglycan lipid II flippase
MSKKVLKKNIGSMSLAVFISRISGLIRDQVFAYFFGVSYVADAFNFAYTIPNLLRRLFGEGALGAAFIPIYQEIGVKKNKSEQIKFAINILSLLTLILTLFSIVGILFAPFIIKLLTEYLPFIIQKLFGSNAQIRAGFDEKTLLLTIKLTRLLFPYLFFIGISSTLISILNSHNFYFVPGLTSAFLNFSMIGMLLVTKVFPEMSSPELSIFLSVGVLIGGFLQVVLNFPLLKRIGYRFGMIFSFKNKYLKELWTKFLPGVWGIAVRQINLLTDRTLASMIVTGSISALNYGNRVMQLPLGIFGVSIGTAVIPHFSKNIAAGNIKGLNEKLTYAVSLVSFIMLPVTVLIFVEGRDYIQILFMRGAFDKKALIMSSNALIFYSLGLVFYSLNRIYTAIFYANKNTKTPFIVASVIVLLNVILNLIFMNYWNYKGLALATSVSSFVQFLILLFLIGKFYPEVKHKGVVTEIFRIIFSSIVLWLVLSFVKRLFEGDLFISVFIRAAAVSISGMILFVLINYFTGSKIVKDFIGYGKK